MKIKQKDLMPELDPTVREIIQKLSNSRTESFRIVQRAQIIKLLSEGGTIISVAEEVRLHRNRVALWRTRFIEALPEINKICLKEGRRECQKLILKVLSDKPRPGSPRKFTSEDRDSIMAVACLDPEGLGENWPISNWSSQLLAMYLTEEEIVSDVSSSTVGRSLIDSNLKPYKRKMWIHSPDKIKDLDEFIRQVREVSSLIKSSQELYSQGIQILSIDEKPGIQAKSPIYKTVPARPGMPALQEMFYTRNGKTDLIQSFNVATGEVLRPYLNETHKEPDFVEALSRAISEQLLLTPGDQIICLCDNLSTHVSEGVVKLIDRILNLNTPAHLMGEKGKWGILKNMETRRSFLTDKSHRIHFVYTPKHASWLNPVECYFSIIERRLLKNGSFSATEILNEKIKAFTGWYNDHSARPFDYQFCNLEEKIQNWIASA